MQRVCFFLENRTKFHFRAARHERNHLASSKKDFFDLYEPDRCTNLFDTQPYD